MTAEQFEDLYNQWSSEPTWFPLNMETFRFAVAHHFHFDGYPESYAHFSKEDIVSELFYMGKAGIA